MPKKIEDEEFDEEFEGEEEEEEEEEIKPAKKFKKEKRSWEMQHIPEVFRVINPETKEIIAQAPNPELLSLQLQVISAQKSTESAKQTE